jgi:hypothetical protein
MQNAEIGAQNDLRSSLTICGYQWFFTTAHLIRRSDTLASLAALGAKVMGCGISFPG